MENPFEIINQRLEVIELLLQEILSAITLEPVKLKDNIELFNIQQTAEYLTLSKSTIYGLIHKQEIPNYKRGKRVYFKKIEIDNWVMQNRRMSIDEIEQKATNYLIKRK
ncbi:MAG: helix-turn-helix domain-containing protein [bacterium]|nr:helix-turn-helix domain-containing protein [bacterium]